MTFHGAKLAILGGGRVVTILRDDRPGIPWPGRWDLPGGGREGGETAAACVLRELYEELGLTLTEAHLHWRRAFPRPEGGVSWFFVHRAVRFDAAQVRFGYEGQRWEMMPVEAFLAHPRAIPNLQMRLQVYLDALDG